MTAVHVAPAATPAAMYDRVVREARISFGPLYGNDAVEQVARDVVDEFMVHQSARVTTFVPVLAMRRLREVLTTSHAPAD